MKNKNRSKAKHPNPPNTQQTATGSETAPFTNIESKRTIAVPPAHSPAAGMPSMFNNAHNTHITGGSFSVATIFNTSNLNGPSLDVLYKRAAPNAILNAGGRADEVRCHPGTREEVISRIEKWGDGEDDQTAPMFWLSGPAGAGKSAIVQTVAERCKQRGVRHANFFFFRGDPSRSHASPLMATLLHQLILLYPSLRDPVTTVLSTNPLLFDSTFEDQLEQLIITPLRSISHFSSTYRPLLLLIDGLDECDSETKLSQEKILRAFDTTLAQNAGACPIRVLVASRDEPQIQVAFNKLSSQCLNLYLNDDYFPEGDIRVFVDAQFEEIRKTHRLAHLLPANWPPVNDVNYIVKKSSGQFIFAATVMRFISGSSAIPMVSLERVRGVVLSTKSPFSHLDAIYTYILSQADDQEALKDILSAQVLLKTVQTVNRSLHEGLKRVYREQAQLTLSRLLRHSNQTYTKVIIHSHLEEVTPLMRYSSKSDQLLFYHASLFDYLSEKSRSEDYFVNIADFSYKILPEVWKAIKSAPRHNSWALFGLSATIQLQKLPPGLMTSVTSSMRKMAPAITPSKELLRVLTIIHKLCTCDDDVINFRSALRLCISSETVAGYKLVDVKSIPFGARYFQMACADLGITSDPNMTATLRPQSDFDRQESASWLNELFHHIRSENLYDPLKAKYLMRDWLSWARANDISCEGLEDLAMKPA